MRPFRSALIVLFVTSCSTIESCNQEAHKHAENALVQAGYSDLHVTDTSSGGCEVSSRCSTNDEYIFDFTATNPAGKSARGYICCGGTWGGDKGCTIRF